jgi:hypothetical protein
MRIKKKKRLKFHLQRLTKGDFGFETEKPVTQKKSKRECPNDTEIRGLTLKQVLTLKE